MRIKTPGRAATWPPAAASAAPSSASNDARRALCDGLFLLPTPESKFWGGASNCAASLLGLIMAGGSLRGVSLLSPSFFFPLPLRLGGGGTSSPPSAADAHSGRRRWWRMRTLCASVRVPTMATDADDESRTNKPNRSRGIMSEAVLFVFYVERDPSNVF